VRIRIALALAGTALFALPAMAGTVTITNGQVTWQSNQCPPPVAPSAAAPGPNTRANDMNARVTEYNSYASAAQVYMNCLSNEAQHDAAAVSQTITNQAQNLISTTQKSVTDLGEPLRQASRSMPAPTPPAPRPMAIPGPTAPPAPGLPIAPTAPSAPAATTTGAAPQGAMAPMMPAPAPMPPATMPATK
jgi:hypothetical protein